MDLHVHVDRVYPKERVCVPIIGKIQACGP
jgi:hypothetical protein